MAIRTVHHPFTNVCQVTIAQPEHGFTTSNLDVWWTSLSGGDHELPYLHINEETLTITATFPIPTSGAVVIRPLVP